MRIICKLVILAFALFGFAIAFSAALLRFLEGLDDDQ